MFYDSLDSPPSSIEQGEGRTPIGGLYWDAKIKMMMIIMRQILTHYTLRCSAHQTRVCLCTGQFCQFSLVRKDLR